MLIEDASEAFFVDSVDDGVDDGVEMRQDDGKQGHVPVDRSGRRPKPDAVYNVERHDT